MPNFLAMMVRAPRAVDLVANSGLAVCSRAPETGGPTFAAVPAPLAAVWMVVVGGDAEFATRSTARKSAHHHGEEMGRPVVGWGVAFHLRSWWPFGGRLTLGDSILSTRSVRAVFRHHPLSPPASASTISSI